MKITLLAGLATIMLFTEYAQAQNSGKLISRKIGRETTIENENYKNFRFTAGGGYAHWTGENLNTGNTNLDNFTSDLRHGYNWDFDAQYFFQEHFGIGLNANLAKHNKDAMNELGIKETDKMFFIGPTCNLRYISGKWGLYTGLGLGPVFYSGKVNTEGAQVSLSKTTFGLNCSISGEYRLSETIGAGLKLSAIAGSFKTDGIDERFSVSNFIITGFISFRTK
ncbi:MAG: porin family protein [Bacteroides sp.]|jgi:hypothetical protein|nr:porin family protein [Bacteroides sp.]MCI1682278.1 porin family protein [Bacteroides sp.]